MNLPDKKYSIIYSDPPWAYKNYNNAKSSSNADHHYKCMAMKDIKELPVQSIADKDCVLLMWCTDPLLNRQIEVISAWGFEYKTVGFYWVKQNKNKQKSTYLKGTGYWTRANPEICLLATKGKPKRLGANVDRLVIADRGIHSRKPAMIKDKIVELCGDLPRIELFARDVGLFPNGWDYWGNEI